jgi:L-Ala-D/L-Glu epimerase
MLTIQYRSINTPFKHPFTTAHGVKTHQPALLIAISYQGIRGIGEAPAIHYYDVSVDGMIEALIQKTPILQRYAFTEPERFWHFCHHLFPNNPFLVCALDMAYWDLYAQFKGKETYQLWNLSMENTPLTDYTIGFDHVDHMLAKIKQTPWPIYKIKVTGADDLHVLQTLRKETDAVFRVDANASWTTETALALIPALAELGVEFIEQPLDVSNWEGMKQLHQQGILPLIADESCVHEQDVARCAEVFDGINIKLTKCGGLTPAKRMIENARALQLKVMMGCMNETEPGSLAIAQFLPLLDFVDMDGPLLLDIPELKRLAYDYGKVRILNRN